MNDEATFFLIPNETEAMALQGLFWMTLQGHEFNYARHGKEVELSKFTEIPEHSTNCIPTHLFLFSRAEEIFFFFFYFSGLVIFSNNRLLFVS